MVKSVVTGSASLESCLKILDELHAMVSLLDRPVELPIFLNASQLLLLLDGRDLS